MSSTNRSNARNNHIADYYVTPKKPIKCFLEKFMKDEGIKTLKYEHILDPCAGGNTEYFNKENDEFVKENKMSYPEVLLEMGANDDILVTNDIRKDSLAVFNEDFLIMNPIKSDIIITNPPFNIAKDIIKRSLEMCNDGGYVIMLLRLNYFGGKVRQEFWKANMPIRAYVHNRRMSFTPDGKTDSVEYMHCVWRKGVNPETTKLSIIYDF